MMSSTTVGVSFKVDKVLRDQFNTVCEKQGYSSSLVFRKLMAQYVEAKSIPTSENRPNNETLAAIENVEAGRNLSKFNSVNDLFEDLGI